MPLGRNLAIQTRKSRRAPLATRGASSFLMTSSMPTNFSTRSAPRCSSRASITPTGSSDDEVYTYASFLQSRMHAAGVTCSDCHNPHTLKLRAAGNAVCAQCHAPETFDTPKHHHHVSEFEGV